MKIITDQEAKEQGVLTKRDLTDIVKALRYERRYYLLTQRRKDELACKIEVNIRRAFGGKP